MVIHPLSVIQEEHLTVNWKTNVHFVLVIFLHEAYLRHYKNVPMKYTGIFSAVKIENLIGKGLGRLTPEFGLKKKK